MRIEIGKEYMCENTKVKAVYFPEGEEYRSVICMRCEDFGFWRGMVGVFDYRDGENSPNNPPDMMNYLTEIGEEVVKEVVEEVVKEVVEEVVKEVVKEVVEEVEDMTMEQVCSELGKKIRIV